MRVPVIHLDLVLHIGTMDPGDAGRNYASSHEGRCLSVSLCPWAWQEIASLGGDGLHELRAEDGLFLDLHALVRDEESLREILDWASGRGLLAEREVWKEWAWDVYSRRWSYEYRESLEAALAGAGGPGHPDRYGSPEEVPGPKGRPGIEAVTMAVATPALQEVSGMACLPFQPDGVRIDPGDHMDAVAMAWAIEEAPALLGRPLDGVWWRDPFSPSRLSAPRGGIFPDRVSAWTATPMEWSEASDRREMRGMPATETVEAEPGPAFAP